MFHVTRPTHGKNPPEGMVRAFTHEEPSFFFFDWPTLNFFKKLGLIQPLIKNVWWSDLLGALFTDLYTHSVTVRTLYRISFVFYDYFLGLINKINQNLNVDWGNNPIPQAIKTWWWLGPGFLLWQNVYYSIIFGVEWKMWAVVWNVSMLLQFFPSISCQPLFFDILLKVIHIES